VAGFLGSGSGYAQTQQMDNTPYDDLHTVAWREVLTRPWCYGGSLTSRIVLGSLYCKL
jgi:hypothetical protein